MPIQSVSQALGNESGGSPFGFKNRIINGAMVIDQRNAGASASSITGYKFFTDRWQSYGSAGGTFTGQQLTTSSAPGFSHYLRLTVTSADASLASDDFYSLQQRIEGYNVSDFGWGTSNAKPITLSFWVRSSLTGQFGGSLMSGYGLPFTYTINQANTWEYKTLSFSPLTSPNWISSRVTNDEGAILWFDLGFGSNYRGTSGVLGGGAYGATGDTNWISTNGATFDITGIQLEKNIQATNFDWRPYGTELQLCQRYYETMGIGCGGTSRGNTFCSATRYAVPKRATPTIAVLKTSLLFSNGSGTATTLNSATLGGAAAQSENGVCQDIYGTFTTSPSNGMALVLLTDNAASISAEL
jgi:hypothetical protein